MATRLYYFEAATPDISPAYSAEWETQFLTVRRYLSLTKRDTFTSGSRMTLSYGVGKDSIWAQYISHARLEAQTISGTIKGQILACEDQAIADCQIALIVKVISGDGATVRGTLLSLFPASLTNEFISGTGARNVFAPPSAALTSVDAQQGDRILIEIGFRPFSSASGRAVWCHPYDGSTMSDLPEDETATAGASWIEFSNTLDWIDEDRIFALGSQVEYRDEPSEARIFSVPAQVEYRQDDAGVRLISCLAQVEYTLGTPIYRTIPLPPEGRVTQNQAFRRRIPLFCSLPV